MGHPYHKNDRKTVVRCFFKMNPKISSSFRLVSDFTTSRPIGPANQRTGKTNGEGKGSVQLTSYLNYHVLLKGFKKFSDTK